MLAGRDQQMACRSGREAGGAGDEQAAGLLSWARCRLLPASLLVLVNEPLRRVVFHGA